MIKPTIGRRVWFRPTSEMMKALDMKQIDPSQAFDAGVVFVHHDRSVNLIVTDHEGNLFKTAGVTLLQDSDEAPLGEPYAQWMPFQTGATSFVKNEATKPAGSPTEGSV